MWGDRRVSVVLMTYAEKDSIRAVIEGFLGDRASSTRSSSSTTTPRRAPSEEVEATDARQVFETAAGLRAREPARADRGDRRPDRPRRARRDVPARGHPQAARLQRRMRRRLRHPHDPRADLARGEHGLVPALGQLGGREADRGALQHQPPERRRLHLPPLHPRARRPRRRADGDRRQPRRARDDAAGDHLRGPLRRDPGQLPAARRHLLGDRQPAGRDRDRPADDRADPPLPRAAPRAASHGRARLGADPAATESRAAGP